MGHCPNGVWVLRFLPEQQRALFAFEDIEHDEYGRPCAEEDGDINFTAHSVLLRKYGFDRSMCIDESGLVLWKDVHEDGQVFKRRSVVPDQALGGWVKGGRAAVKSGTCNATLFIPARAREVLKDDCRWKNLIKDHQSDQVSSYAAYAFEDTARIVRQIARLGHTSPEKPFVVHGEIYNRILDNLISVSKKSATWIWDKQEKAGLTQDEQFRLFVEFESFERDCEPDRPDR
jgi:hypothetical protein